MANEIEIADVTYKAAKTNKIESSSVWGLGVQGLFGVENVGVGLARRVVQKKPEQTLRALDITGSLFVKGSLAVGMADVSGDEIKEVEIGAGGVAYIGAENALIRYAGATGGGLDFQIHGGLDFVGFQKGKDRLLFLAAIADLHANAAYGCANIQGDAGAIEMATPGAKLLAKSEGPFDASLISAALGFNASAVFDAGSAEVRQTRVLHGHFAGGVNFDIGFGRATITGSLSEVGLQVPGGTYISARA